MFVNIPKKYFLIAVAIFAAGLAYFTVSPEKGEIKQEYATKVVDVASEEKIIVNVDNIKASLSVDADKIEQAQKEAAEAAKKAEEEAQKAKDEAEKQKEEAAKKKAEEQAKAEEEARKKAEEEARKKAEEEANKKKEEDKKQEEQEKPVTGLQKGSVIYLNNEPLYMSSTITTPKNYKTGKYYVWGMEANGRITITSSPDYVGVKGHVTGWIKKPAQ